MNITRGKIAKAQKVVAYGPEGIGKSTFAAQFPDPVFIDTEGSTTHMDVARLDTPTSWAMLINEIEYIKATRPCKTLVLDTADWAETLCTQDLCARNHWNGIEDPGYGKGYIYLGEEFGKMLNKLNDVIEAGINVVITAHAQMRKFEQPDELGAYDRWELKLQKKTAPLLKEWADMVLFANYKTIVVNVDNKGVSKGKNKAQGGQRVMYTAHHPCWDAKNRHNLDEVMPFDYTSIASIFKDTATPPIQSEPVVESNSLDMREGTGSGPMAYTVDAQQPMANQNEFDGIPKALMDLMLSEKVTEGQIRKAVASRGYYPEDMAVKDYPKDFIEGCLIGGWPQVLKMINDQILPF